MLHQSVCYNCSEKCVLNIDKQDNEIVISGNKCHKGIDYGKESLNNSKGVLTTLVRVKGAKEVRVVPVKSTAPIDKSLWLECSKALSRVYVGVPIKIGDIVCKNILNTGVDIVCTRNTEKL
jgi:CxxC motif-containing protein